MTQSALVKIGVPSEQAESMKKLRRVREILDQRDAAVARLNAVTEDRIRELVTDMTDAKDESPVEVTGASDAALQ
jgi:hypothetical protein